MRNCGIDLTFSTPLALVAAVAGALAAMVLLSGCAFTTGHVNLDYQSQVAPTKVATANSPRISVAVTDKRPTQTVGHKINGYGIKTAEIVSDSDVPATVKKAFEQELEARGFTPGSGGILVNVSLNDFESEYSTGWFSGQATANMGLDVTVVETNGAIAFEKHITGHNEESVMYAGEGNAQVVLNAAMRDAVSNVFGDPAFLNALMGHGQSSDHRSASETSIHSLSGS